MFFDWFLPDDFYERQAKRNERLTKILNRPPSSSYFIQKIVETPSDTDAIKNTNIVDLTLYKGAKINDHQFYFCFMPGCKKENIKIEKNVIAYTQTIIKIEGIAENHYSFITDKLTYRGEFRLPENFITHFNAEYKDGFLIFDIKSKEPLVSEETVTVK